MNKKIQLILMCFFSMQILNAQSISVLPETCIHVKCFSMLNVKNFNMNVYGHWACEDNSVVTLGGENNPVEVYGDENIQFSYLNIDGNMLLDVPDVNVNGGIIMKNGILDITQSVLYLSPTAIIGKERQESFVKGNENGKIIKTMQFPESKIYTGMGLDIELKNKPDNLTVIKGFRDFYNERNEKNSGNYYTFSIPVNLGEIKYACFGIPIGSKGYYIAASHFQDYWHPLISTMNNNIAISNYYAPNTMMITLFMNNDITYSEILTPNGDGVNDNFCIYGMPSNELSRLIIYTKEGVKIFDETPYRNSFTGDGYACGTYYFSYYDNKADDKPLKKGVFELIK